MKIYIVGYMGSGKTKLGADLAELLDFSFIDLDNVFEEKYRISVNDFFEKYGETAFRQLEQQLLENTAQLDSHVISTGGGTPCFFENMEFILKNGISVYLRLPVELLAERLSHTRQKRPLLHGLTGSEFNEFIEKHLSEREPFYLKATVIADKPDAMEIAAELKKLLPR